VAETQPEDDKNSEITAPGCILVVISVAVIFCVALPVVRWRGPVTGEPLPKMIAIFVPIMFGALVNGIGTVILKLLGIPVVRKKKKGTALP
jgi:hypothetical protein